MSVPMSSKQITLNVPETYVVDPWLTAASAEEVALVLDLASRLPRIVGDEKNDMTARLEEARNKGTTFAIRKVLEEASQTAASRYQDELATSNVQLEQFQQRYDTTASALQTTQHELNEWKTKYDHDLQAKDFLLRGELDKIKVFEEHLKQTSDLKMESLKRDITLQTTQQYQQLHDEYNIMKSSYHQLQQSTDQLVRDARQEELQKSTVRERQIHDTAAASYAALTHTKMESDAKLVELATLKCELAEQIATEQAHHSKHVQTLQDKINDLKNPLNRGTAGEVDVAQTLRDVGFHVEDTSEGEKKDTGYLDLLVKPDETTTSNMRIAVEVKNKKTIKKASDDKVKKKEKDLDDDIKTFQQRATDGIARGLFDAAIFVSIRAHTKMGAPVFLEMFEDTTNRPLAPVSYIGPEKSKVVIPLTQEQLETHVYMMFCVLDKCHAIKRDLCNGLKDEEIASFQSLFENMGAFLNKTFVDLRKQENLLHDMSVNLTSIRSRCIAMFRSIYSINANIPWLQRKLNAEWMPVYDSALERATTMSDAEVWNRVCKSKSTIENTIGKDGMFLAIRSELKEPEPPPKRAKSTEESSNRTS